MVNTNEVKLLDDGRQLRTVLIRDETGEAKFDLWQQHVGTLTIAKTYIISNAMVKICSEEYSLTTPKDGSLKIE